MKITSIPVLMPSQTCDFRRYYECHKGMAEGVVMKRLASVQGAGNFESRHSAMMAADA